MSDPERKICPNCGKDKSASAKFCDDCGMALTTGTDSDKAPVTPAPEARPNGSEDQDSALPGSKEEGASLPRAEPPPDAITLEGKNSTISIVDAHGFQGEVIVSSESSNIPGNVQPQRIIKVTDQSGNRGIIAESLTIVGTDQSTAEKQDTEKITLTDLGVPVWRKVQAVFVAPAAYTSYLSPEIRKTASKDRNERIFIIQGKAHSGTSTCAIHLGWELLNEPPEPKFSMYRRTQRETRPLIDFVQYSKLGKDTVYLVEQGFENGVSPEEFSQVYLPEILNILKKNNDYLILTTNDQSIPQGLSVPVLCTDERVTDAQRSKAIHSHLEWYRQHTENTHIIPELLDRLSDSQNVFDGFLHPYQVDRFIIKLGQTNLTDLMLKSWESEKAPSDPEMPPNEKRAALEVEVLKHLGQSIVRPMTEAPRAWFNQLSENIRLYAMLVGLFENVEKSWLDELYNLAVQRLRADGVANLHNHREIGRYDRLEAIHAEEKEDHLVHFESAVYFVEVQNQIDNRHDLLWSLIEMWGVIIQLFQGVENWELRRSFGAAIGRLGIHYPEKLQIVLDALARHESGSVVAVAGYALEELCRVGKQNHILVIEILERWAKSGHPDDQWAAAAAVWRIYGRVAPPAQESLVSNDSLRADKEDAICKRLWQVLNKIGENCGQFDLKNKVLQGALKASLKQNFPDQVVENLEGWQTEKFPPQIARQVEKQLNNWTNINANAVIFALLRIAEGYPKDVVAHIQEWLEIRHAGKDSQASATLLALAKASGAALFRKNSRPEMPLLDERHLPLLDLVGPLLATGPETADAVFATLLVWLEQPGWPEKIHAALLKVINRATSKAAAALRASLVEHWLDSDRPDAVSIGRALLARSYAMDGAPLDIPGHGCAVLDVDASHRGALNNAAYTGHQIACVLEARLDTFSFCMGNAHPATRPGRTATTTDLRTPHDLPRLVQPGLMSLPDEARPRLRCLVVLTWDEIHDLDDLDDITYEEQLLLVGPNLLDKPERESAVVRTQQQPNPSDLQVVENKLDRLIGRYIGRLNAADWWEVLASRLPGCSPQPEAIIGMLDTWADQLDDLSSSQASEDMARRLVVVGLWLAKADWPRLVGWVIDSLNQSKPENLRYWAAKALGKLLFKVYGACQPVPELVTNGKLLDVIEPLTRERRDWGTVQCVLDAFHHWFTSPAWEHVLLGLGGLSIAERPFLSRDWLSLLVENTPPADIGNLKALIQSWKDKEQPEAIRQAADRLEFRLELGETGQFPHLPDKSKYALILLDASHRRSMELAEVVEWFTKELVQNNALKDRYVVIVSRLGQRGPLTIKGQAPEAVELITETLPALPTLAAHQLARVNPSNVGFILLLSNNTIIDQDDWADDWKQIPFLACSNARRFPEIPPYAHPLPWYRTPKETALNIAAYIQDFLKG